jgi:RND family efflux transporter MFP subunit
MNDKIRVNVRPSTRVLVVILSLALVAGAFFLARRLIRTAPRPALREPRERARLVETVVLAPGRERTEIIAAGPASPARQVELKARVAGQVARTGTAFRPGGRFAAGEEILALDPEDYRLALAERKSDLARAEAEYRIELGRQDIARHEWELLGEGEEASEIDRELAMRLPQLKQAEAALDAARAALRRAELNLERTSVLAPFNAVVISKSVDLGAEVTTATPLAVLAGTDQYWVNLSLPVDELEWFEAGEGDSGAEVLLSPAADPEVAPAWTGRVIEKEAALEESGRLARVLVAVPRPLEGRPLLLGMYLRARIEGRELAEVFSIPRSALRDHNRVWLVGPGNRLEMRQVRVLKGSAERVLVREGLQPGEELVISDLAGPVAGMLLRRSSDESGDPSL